jgi:hypothetical protein
VESNWVHSALRPLICLLCQPWVIMMMKNLVEWLAGKTEVLGGKLSTTNPTCCPDANPGRRCGKPATNRLGYGTALVLYFILYILFLLSFTVLIQGLTYFYGPFFYILFLFFYFLFEFFSFGLSLTSNNLILLRTWALRLCYRIFIELPLGTFLLMRHLKLTDFLQPI